MATAKSLRRQAATCANLANETYDEESRERLVRLERLYLQLADSEEEPVEQTGTYASDSKSDTVTHQAN